MTDRPYNCGLCATPLDAPGICRECAVCHRTVADQPAVADLVRAATLDPKTELLEAARRAVCGQRRTDYGDALTSFTATADLFNAYLRARGIDYTDPEQGMGARDAAILMALVKIARLAHAPEHHDSKVDIAGYAAVLAEIDAELAKKGVNRG